MKMRAAALLVLCSFASACSSSSTPASSVPSECVKYDGVFAASDYASSGFGALSLGGQATYTSTVDLGSDPVLAASRGRLFLVARDNDVVFELDPHCGTALGKISVHDASRAGTSNPQDIAVSADGALWIPRYNVPSLLVTSADGSKSSSLDLSSYDEDHNPNASAIRIVSVSGADKAFVTLERLDDTATPPAPRLPSQILRVDVATQAVEAAITLEGKNPFGLTEYGGAFYLAEPGDFTSVSEATAGIEVFDPQTSTSHLLAHETDLGGSVTEVAVTTGCGVAIVADASTQNRTSLVAFDPASGKVLGTPLGPTDGFDLQALAWKGNVLMVGDRRQVTGGYAVHAFEKTDACTLQQKPDTLLLPQKPIAIRVPQ